jgi:hypothetical protein
MCDGVISEMGKSVEKEQVREEMESLIFDV